MLRIICVASLLFSQIAIVAAEELKPGVRGLATRAPADMKIDGDRGHLSDR